VYLKNLVLRIGCVWKISYNRDCKLKVNGTDNVKSWWVYQFSRMENWDLKRVGTYGRFESMSVNLKQTDIGVYSVIENSDDLWKMLC